MTAAGPPQDRAPRPAPAEEAARLLAAGRKVIAAEAEALAALAAALPEDFAPAVRRIAEVRGRVIVSGIGKSGHVGRKIAATLASTGTPAIFVHAAEASHGDLGMITPQDVALVLSNSGETAELGDLIHHTRRFAIPLIGVSSRPDSLLMRVADHRLLLPARAEVCPLGLAPTTSTTMMLALGDALALTVMEQRGFAPEQFRQLHPGGRLGAQLAEVGTLMHGAEAVPRVAPEAPMAEVLVTMTSKGFGIAAVVDAEGRLTGVISDGDLRRHADGLMARRAGEIANPDPVSVPPTMLAAEALRLINERKIGALVVVDEARRPLGVLHVHDLLRAGVA